MQTTWLTRAMRSVGVALLASAVVGVTVASARPPDRPGRPRAISLFATAGLLLTGNRQVCGLDNVGNVCTAFAGSPVGGGGFWPQGTVDQYIYNSGMQLVGIVDPAAGFTWAADTVGAYLFDARGTQGHGDGLTGVFNSIDPNDVAQWPNGAVIRQDNIYNSALLEQPSISQQDSWVRYWEGDPSFLSGRTHPMGLMIEQRSLAWNYPSGNEDILYFVFTFYNVTARGASGAYNNPTIPGPIQAEVAAIGDQFQNLNEAKFGVAIPDGGYTIENMYAAFGMDADVAVFNTNYSTAVLPFNMATTYAGDFLPQAGWTFPPDIFGAPFAAAPGFVGVKYLRSPESSPGNFVGLTLFSTLLNSATGFPDPVGVNQLFRYLSGYLGTSDNSCNPFTDPAQARARRLCFLATNQGDSRFFQSSGPFILPPGEARTIVVAYIHAAPLAAPLAATPGGGIGADNVPGVPYTGDSIAQDPGKVRDIDRVMGWVSERDLDQNGIIEERGDSGFEVQTAPRSLLNKALVAQAVYEAGFLLPFSPTAPNFYLVPGDNQVTVVWTKSETETVRPGGGDPYFGIASDPNSPLYDPNFRQYDVEGYRIYRGRTSGQLEVIAQFDYTGTTIIDYTGGFDYGSECAPELGITVGCPSADFATDPVSHEIAGDVIQIPPGQRVELASGAVLNLVADTAVSGGTNCASPTGPVPCPSITNSGVPFAFVDLGVRNSFTYAYAVTAYDVNSVASGPSSLESPRVTKTVTVRGAAPNEVQAELASALEGDDGVALDPTFSWDIDGATGKFPGPPPPTSALSGAFAPLVPQLLPQLDLKATIDSLVPRSGFDFACPAENALGVCYELYVSFNSGGAVTSFVVVEPWPVWTSFGEDAFIDASLGALPIPADSASVERFGIPQGFAQFNATVAARLRESIRFSSFENHHARRNLTGNGAGISPGGSRWFDGANESVDHPGAGIRVGHLAGVDTVWRPLSHSDIDPGTAGVQQYASSGAMQCLNYSFAALGRQADVEFTWGAGGQIASVRDITHHVNVPFSKVLRASYGFVGDNNGNGWIDWEDFTSIDPLSQNAEYLGFCNWTDPGPAARDSLLPQPVMLPVAIETQGAAGTGAGMGFGLYIDGERYLFRLTGGTAPADGTVWTLRTYAGVVRATSGADTYTPSGYRLSKTDPNPIIPGLNVTFNVAAATSVTPEEASVLSNVHTVPDPYYVTNSLEQSASRKILKFVNLPPQAIIRIYSLSGVLVNVLVHNSASFGAEATWNLRNRNNQFVASGVYFYQVETPSGNTKLGRFTIVNFAP